MGLRFRKSSKIAPGVKVNLNKKSNSVTFGGKGFHYTVNSKGKTTKSFGIPGTGLSYSTSSNKKIKHNDNYSNVVFNGYSDFVNTSYADILTNKEYAYYEKCTLRGVILDADPKAILTQSGKRNTITVYNTCYFITLFLSVILLLISLLGFTYSPSIGIVFLIFSALLYFPFRGYRKMVNIHHKIFLAKK